MRTTKTEQVLKPVREDSHVGPSAQRDSLPPQAPVIGPFFTLQQIAERHPAFSVRTLRHWIANAAARRAWQNRRAVIIPGNGFDRVMVRKGRRIFINEAALFAWLARDSPEGDTPEK
ncbi:MAG TPA: hypothetical protein VHR45_17500 [Thermoanaerobaculia bacterium]|nr:hypothetical protein [Thermoanaerobaculia bacterium]